MQKYMPVDPRTPVGGNVIEQDLYTLPDNSLELPPFSAKDIYLSMKRSKKSVNKNDLQEFVDWTNQFGEEG
jgi:hypothetical protein